MEERRMETSTARLVMLAGPNTGGEYRLEKEMVLLGRDEKCDVIVADVEVSRQHARITGTPQGYVLEDLGSTNGTFLDGDRVTGPRLLEAGSRIALSETVVFAFELEEQDTEATVVAGLRGEGETAPTPIREPSEEELEYQSLREQRRSRLPQLGSWAYAGCGCLVILAVIGIVFWFMPLSWWCLLLSPLELIGLYFAGC
jgi:hypothetical protein